MKHDHSFIPRVFLFKYDGASESNHHHHSSDGSTLYHQHDDLVDSHGATYHGTHNISLDYGLADTHFGPADHAHA